MYKILTASVLFFLFFLQSIAQKNSSEADFIQLELFAEQADYKGGYFYAKKLISTLEKKGSEINILRSNCFLAYFSDMLNK